MRARIFELMQALAQGDSSAQAGLQEIAAHAYVWNGGRASLVVPRTSDRPELYLSWFPASNGGSGNVINVPLPPSFILANAVFQDGVFELHTIDERIVSARLSGFSDMVCEALPGCEAQYSADDLDAALASLSPCPQPATGSVTVKQVTLTASEFCFGYEGSLQVDGNEVFLYVRAAHETQLRSCMASLEGFLLQLPARMEAARRFMAEKEVLGEEGAAALVFSELVFYPNGAADLCAGVEDGLIDFLTVHLDTAGTPVEYSLN